MRGDGRRQPDAPSPDRGTAARRFDTIDTQSDWVTAVRYYRGVDTDAADQHIGARQPVTALAVTGWLATFAAFVIALLLVVDLLA